MIKNNQGVSLLLTILILSALLVFTLAASNIILRITKTTREIGESEIAYYAAESAIEEALYAIEKNKNISGLGLSGTLTTSQGTWTRLITLQNKATTSCPALKPASSFCVEDPDLIIDTQHPLIITLYDNGSFQLDLDIEGFPVGSYPSKIEIKAQGSATGTIVYLDNNGQTTYPLPPNQNISIDPSQGSKIRIIKNETGDNATGSFEIKPLGNTTLPIGLIITGTGSYKAQERKIELERRNWQIY